MVTMRDLISQVTNVGTGAKKFATKEANFTGSQILYILEQCTPDISSSDCSMCIQEAIAVLPGYCRGMEGARVISPSCRIGYEMFQFYRTLNIAATPTLLPSPPPGSGQ